MLVAELLNSPEKWTRRACARDSKEQQICSLDSRAVCWCLYGAILYCYREQEQQEIIFRKISKRVGSIGEWNDAPERTFEDIQKLVAELQI